MAAYAQIETILRPPLRGLPKLKVKILMLLTWEYFTGYLKIFPNPMSTFPEPQSHHGIIFLDITELEIK